MDLYPERPFTSRHQELLLQAALLKGNAAVNAWEEWTHAVDLQGHPDSGSFRLMPLLYTNMRQHGVKHPFMKILKGIYRQTWYRNQRLFAEKNRVLQFFSRAGIKTMLLKGTALTVLAYQDDGIRPVSGIDLLVPSSLIPQTIDILHKAGWIPTAALKERDLMYRYSMQFKNQSENQLDIHWRPFYDCRTDGVRHFWDGAVSITPGKTPVLAPDTADMLFHLIAHGVDWSPEPPIQWIADAITLLRTHAHVDWSRLLKQVEEHQVCLRFRDALNYLHYRFQSGIPDSIINHINSIRISRLEYTEYRFIMNVQNPDNTTPFTRFLGYLCQYMRLMNGGGGFRLMTGFLKYLQWKLNAKSYFFLFSHHISRGISETIKIYISKLVAHN